MKFVLMLGPCTTDELLEDYEFHVQYAAELRREQYNDPENADFWNREANAQARMATQCWNAAHGHLKERDAEAQKQANRVAAMYFGGNPNRKRRIAQQDDAQ